MGAMSRNKGKTFERTVANAFKEVFPSAKRTLTQQRDSGEAPDIEIPEWWVEAKAHKKVVIRRAFEQAVDEVKRARSKLKPVAVTKDNGKEPLATMRLSTFLELLRELETLRGKKGELVSTNAHIRSVETFLDQELGPVKDIEATILDRIRALIRKAERYGASTSTNSIMRSASGEDSTTADWQRSGN